MQRGWGWAGSVEEFLSTPVERFEESLAEHHLLLLGGRPSSVQTAVWRAEHETVIGALQACCVANPDAVRWGVAFEYELPLEGGRRPDVVILAGGTIVVLEFKSASRVEQAYLDQVEAYARDLSEYHQASHGRKVLPILVMSLDAPFSAKVAGVAVTDGTSLAPYIYDAASDGQIDLDEWLRSPYAPLPTLVAAARRIFEHEPLPHVRSALSAGIPEALDLLARLIDEAARGALRLLILVAGVPGSGKTLVGLRLVYERSETEGRATFLSGNGPLVQVLQDALQSKVFVRDLHAFIRTYGINRRLPIEHILVFDEAQRAWDAHFMLAKRGVPRSEPELLVEVGERIPDWSSLVGLVGDGQEIFSGEEGGMAGWRDALADSTGSVEGWRVHGPPRITESFDGFHVSGHKELDLTVSLRSRRAEKLHDWVGLLLEGSIPLAKRRAVDVQNAGFPMYLTRDLEEAKDYVRSRYAGEPEKRYGILASSHANAPLKFGLDNAFLATRKVKVARWFNAPAEDPASGCGLVQPITEFQCQGLEVDLPLVVWGEDYLWSGVGWSLKPKRRKFAPRDAEQLLKNAYRVLLTRGRDGLVVFLPPDRIFDPTEIALLGAGLEPLPEPLEAAVSGEEAG